MYTVPAPEGYRDIPEEDRRKAKAFFDRAATVAGTGNYDYGIELYLQGLNLDPEAVDAHQALREVSMKRKATGGKALGLMSKFARTSKDDKEAMLAAEKLMAFDPGNTTPMVAMIQAAQRAGFYDTVMWLGPLLLRANVDGKNEVAKFLALKDVYRVLKQWRRATEACQFASAAKPDDMELAREVKDLSARQTMDEGNYEGGGSFRDSIRDREGQEKLQRQDSDIRTDDQMSKLIRDAESQYLADPNEAGKLVKLVDLLTKTEDLEQENRAIELLEAEYAKTRQFRFRLRVGDIRLRQLNRMERSMRERVLKNPGDKELESDYRQFVREKVEEELKEFKLAADNYPTQLDYQFQVARRLFELDRQDEAIPVFQKARQDPKFRVDASVMLGRSFLAAKYVDEAVDTLKVTIDGYQLKGDEKSIDMTYWYARSLEEKGDQPSAIKAYSQVAQWNFTYRDVQARIKRLRAV